jgi:diaminopimelate epimerase
MAATAFTKMHGLGNDFLVIDARKQPVTLAAGQVRQLADRHTGIGFDQLILIETGAVADVRLRFWNSDGSEVGACGNGSRAAAALLGGTLTMETGGGLLHAAASAGAATVDMGAPRHEWQAVPLAFAMDTAALPLAWAHGDCELAGPTALSVGNPHAVFFVGDADAVPLDVLGPRIEQDTAFPEGVNVGAAQLVSRSAMRLRVWERGAGLTRACGTGAVAAVAAAQRRGLADARVMVTMPGGDLVVERRDDGHLLLSGPAVIAYTGQIDLEQYQ